MRGEDSKKVVELTPWRVKNLDEVSGGLNSLKEEATTTEIIDLVLSSAIAVDASDIHFETGEDGVHLRLRLDGLLNEVHRFETKKYLELLNRLKLTSGLKINISDKPQDGRFSVLLGGREIEVRTSTIPSEFGETIVLRILDPKNISLELKDLGLRKDDEASIRGELKKPNGMILVTGPTGSGKTTTLYAFLKLVRDPGLKLITIEDPIEYHLEGVEQTQVDEASGYVFSSGLKSILRQDPDIILVGEIRDLETAEIAFHAALTGHLVFSTLHTNSAVGAVPRLIDLGTKSSIIGPALNLVIAERLVRKLCPHCRKAIVLEKGLDEKIKNFIKNLPAGARKSIPKETILYQAAGCSECRSGYRGRIGVFELMEFNDNLRELINQEANEVAIGRLAKKQGLVSVQEDGLIKVLSGTTTLEEVERVTGPIEW